MKVLIPQTSLSFSSGRKVDSVAVLSWLLVPESFLKVEGTIVPLEVKVSPPILFDVLGREVTGLRGGVSDGGLVRAGETA
jgi:hypothetical protein